VVEGRHIAPRPWSWLRGHERLVDGLLAALVILPGAGDVAGHWDGSPARGAVLSLLQLGLGLPLYWRRRWPVPAAAVVTASLALVIEVEGDWHDWNGAALLLAAYAVSVHGAGRPRLAVAALSAVAVLAGGASPLLGVAAGSHYLLPLGALALVGWVIGDYFRERRRYLLGLETRAEELEHRAEESRRQAAEEERLRIARELHDVVAHNVSVIALQAGGALLAGPAAGRQALTTIEVTARDTLAELNRLLGVLRHRGSPPDRAPQPGLARVEALLRHAREAGLAADLRLAGEPRPLPAAVELSAYRIVQEAVTNTLRHAGASRLEVRIGYGQDALELSIVDDGRGVSAEALAASTGHGLIGIRERVELFGGDLAAGSSSLGGFSVRAHLPLGGGA
jgi:signal transduction histidine kinase